jgi:hypothetical protein
MRFIPTTDEIVARLRKQAKRLQRAHGGKHTDLLTRVAKGAGYDHWHHVIQCQTRSPPSDISPTHRPDEVSTYAQVAEKTGLVRRVFETRRIALHPQSVLSQMFNKAEALAETAKSGSPNGSGIEHLIAAMHANRISDAILGVAEEALAQELLLRIAKKDMDLALRAASHGKDALWELELLAFLRRKGARAWLQEPDIVVSLDGTAYPIACKKINADSGTVSQVRSACKQLRNFGAQGIVALNIDELVPENSVLRGPTVISTGRHLQELAEEYLDRHRLDLQKAVAGEKCDAIIISITSLAEIEGSKPKWNYQTESMFWSVSDKNTAGRDRLMQLGKIISAPPTVFRP